MLHEQIILRNMDELSDAVDRVSALDFRVRDIRNFFVTFKDAIEGSKEHVKGLKNFDELIDLNDSISILQCMISMIENGTNPDRICREIDILIWSMLEDVDFFTGCSDIYTFVSVIDTFESSLRKVTDVYMPTSDESEMEAPKDLSDLKKIKEEFEKRREERISYKDLYYFTVPSKDIKKTLNWIFLYHEIAHSKIYKLGPEITNILKKHGTAELQTFIKQDLDEERNRILAEWAEETSADIFALLVGGPAYLNAFIHDKMLDNNFRLPPEKRHPPDSIRVAILIQLAYKLNYNKDVEFLVNAWLKLLGDEIKVDSVAETVLERYEDGNFYEFYKCLIESKDDFFKMCSDFLKRSDLESYMSLKKEMEKQTNFKELSKRMDMTPISVHNPVIILNVAWEMFVSLIGKKGLKSPERKRRIKKLNALAKKSILTWHFKEEWNRYKTT